MNAKSALIVLNVLIRSLALLGSVVLSLTVQYMILSQIQASSLLWFLYWCQVPFAGVLQISSHVIKWLSDHAK